MLLRKGATSAVDMSKEPVALKDSSEGKDSKVTGSSCLALRSAVAKLNRLDDFYCEKIGTGFFSEVFKVTHKVSGEVMVLKMNLLRSNRPNMLKEVQLMKQLSHPNILSSSAHTYTPRENRTGALIDLKEFAYMKASCTLSLKTETGKEICLGNYDQKRSEASICLSNQNKLRILTGFLTGHCRLRGYLTKLGLENDRMFVVRENRYINGGRLEQIIQDSSIPLSYSVRMKIALDIAKGMQYLHSKDIFHRDLTSKNIFVKTNEETGEMIAVVGDFGFAARIPRYGCRLATVGSAYWMSPECIKGQWYDQTSDIFSYGIILCEMIARVDADPDILPRTSNFGLDYIAFTSLCKDDTPKDFLKLAFQCCNYDPSQRPSFSEIVTQLESIIWNSKGPKYEGKAESTDSTSKESTGHNKLGHRRSLSDDSIRVLGETMAQQDAYYKPAAQNPFANIAAFKGGKKIVSHSSSDTGCCTGGRGVVGDGESDDITAASSTDSSTVVAEPVVKPSKILQSLRLGEKLVDKASLLDAIFAGGWCFVNNDATNKNRMNEKEHSQRFTRGTSEIVGTTETPRRKIPPVIMPPSLPSSPTFTRRMTSSPIKPHHSLPTYRLRTCSSGSNLTFLDDHVGLPVLRRRGSCESGFFSSVGEDFCLPGNDLIASSVTLSSSSAASSLLLDSGSACCDPGEGGTCTSALYRSGGGGQYCLQRRGMYQGCRSDSSEEVSLDGHHMEDRCRSFTNQQAQIHKMVEYFERKGSGVNTENSSSSSRTPTYPVREQLRYQLRSTYENRLLRRQSVQQQQQQQSSSPASTNSSPSVASTSSPSGGCGGGGGGVGSALSSCSSSSLHSTTTSSSSTSSSTQSPPAGIGSGGGGGGSVSGSSGVPVHRLIVCEGAVRSKLQIFDKK